MNKLMLLLCLIKSICDFLVNDIELFTDVSVIYIYISINHIHVFIFICVWLTKITMNKEKFPLFSAYIIAVNMFNKNNIILQLH